MLSSFGPKSGDRGRAINPVRADSKIPNGETSFMKESIRVGFADLKTVNSVLDVSDNKISLNLHFNNAVIRADVQDLAPELVSQAGNSVQMFVLMP